MDPTFGRIIRLSIGVFIASKLLTVLSVSYLDYVNGINTGTTRERVTHFLYTWDSGWYTHIAQHGYDQPVLNDTNNQSPLAFYPLYPLTIRAFTSLSGLSYKDASLLLSNGFHLIALILFGLYCRSRGGDWEVIRNGTTLFAFCPHGIAFMSAYTESLFVMLTLASLLSFDSGRYYLSSACSAALTAARSNGVFILIFYFGTLAQDAYTLWKEKKPLLPYLLDNSGKFLPVLFTPLGLFAFWWFSFNLTGDAFAQKSTALHGWSREIGFPFSPLSDFLSGNFKLQFNTYCILALFACSGFLLTRKLYRDFAYCLASFLLFFSNTNPDSLLRYAVAVVPVYLGISLVTRKSPLAYSLVLTSFVVVNLLTIFAWYERHTLSL